MKIYRGVVNLLFKNIDPLYKNLDDEWLDYGLGTSYATDINLAQDYCSFSKYGALKFSWLLTYDFKEKNTLYLEDEKNIIEDEEDGVDSFFFNGNTIEKKDLSQYATQNNFDAIWFLYDELDPHLLLTPLATSEQLSLVEVQLFTQNQEIVDKLLPLNMPFDGEYFSVPLSLLTKVDSILEGSF